MAHKAKIDPQAKQWGENLILEIEHNWPPIGAHKNDAAIFATWAERFWAKLTPEAQTEFMRTWPAGLPLGPKTWSDHYAQITAARMNREK